MKKITDFVKKNDNKKVKVELKKGEKLFVERIDENGETVHEEVDANLEKVEDADEKSEDKQKSKKKLGAVEKTAMICMGLITAASLRKMLHNPKDKTSEPETVDDEVPADTDE